MAEEVSSVPALAVTAAVGAVVLLLVLLCSVGKRDKKQSEDDSKSDETNNATKSKPEKSEKHGKKTKAGSKPKRSQSIQFLHPWLSTTLKGNSGYILGLDFSPNGKYLINTAEDRTLMMWYTKDFNQKEHKFIRANVELDHTTKVRFSPDTKAFIGSLGNDNTVRIFRIGKKDDGSPGNISAAFDFPKKHSAEIINIGIASNGKFIMTCSRDTTIIIWSIKGDLYTSVDTHQMNNSYGAVSPCGRFVASSGFTPDVKVWEVCFDKGGMFQDVKRAFELKGHSAGVFCFSFSNDSSRMASVSKDGTWKYWDTNVRYELGQEAYLLRTGNIQYTSPSLISLSPDGRTIVVGADNSIKVFNAITGDEEESMDNVHSGGIVDLAFDTTNKYFVSAGDKHIHVFHNITGYRATVADLEEKEKKASGQAMKERIRQQILDAKSSLSSILEQANGHAESK